MNKERLVKIFTDLVALDSPSFDEQAVCRYIKERLTALGVPAIMVPSPYVTNNHQEKNARALETHGGVEVLLEQDSSGQALFQTAAGILRDDARREAMASAMAELGIRDAAQRIYETVQELL